MSDGNTTTNINQQSQTVNGTQINADRVNVGHIGDVIHQAPKEPISFPLHYIALSKNPHFTGRADELERIHAAVGDGGVGVITQAIAGLGGVGKTQLVAEYAHLHVHEYDLIYWLPANDELTLMEAMATLAYRLQVAKLEDAQPQAAARAAIHWLENNRQRWLLLVDNADLPQMTPAIVESYLPKTGNGAVLISSRNSDWGGWKTLELNVFSDDEAVAFMTARLGATATADKQSAIALARELGGLALALEHAVAYVDRHAKTIADYLRLFRARQKALWDKAKPPRDYQEKTITTTWTISFEALAADAPDAAALLNLCAFFAPNGIPMALLAEHAATLPPQLDACAADELLLDEAIAAAQSHSLLTMTADGLNMHRLVQLVARGRLGDEAATGWVETAMKLLSEAWPFDKSDMTTLEACEQLLPHLMVAVELAAALGVVSQEASFLNNQVGFYLQNYGDLVRAETFYQQALDISKKVLGDDHPDTAGSLNNIGYWLQAMGDYEEALPFFQQALDTYKNVLGDDHLDTAKSLNNMGYLLQAMGDYKGALPFYQQALDIRKKVLGDDDPDTASILNNMGHFLDSMRDYEGARPFYQQALDIRKKVLGDDHPDTAGSLNNMGYLLQVMGDYKGALPFYQQALDIRKKVLGDNHPATAQSLNNIGYLLKTEGDYEAAVPYYEQAIAICEAKLGIEHPKSKAVRDNLMVLQVQIGLGGIPVDELIDLLNQMSPDEDVA